MPTGSVSTNTKDFASDGCRVLVWSYGVKYCCNHTQQSVYAVFSSANWSAEAYKPQVASKFCTKT